MMQKALLPHDDNLPLFHLNIFLLGYHLDSTEDVLNTRGANFHVVKITESRLKCEIKD